MFLNDIDRLSPQINLYYNGYSRHPSIFSGILTFIIYAIIFAFTISYFVEFAQKKKPNVYYTQKYIEDTGSYPINNSSLFNFIQILNKNTNRAKAVDFDSVRIIGIQDSIENYMSSNDLSLYNHWLYGNCNNDSDTEGIGHLITQDYFTQSACIRKYYNKNEKKYYSTTDHGFIWPSISKGNSNPDKTSFGIIMEKCKNDALRTSAGSSNCKSDTDIENYIYSSAINFFVVDNSIDVLNYKQPFDKYLYPITNNIHRNLISINNINFNPALLKTHKGGIFDMTKEENSYFFSKNEKYSINDEAIPNPNPDTNTDTGDEESGNSGGDDETDTSDDPGDNPNDESNENDDPDDSTETRLRNIEESTPSHTPSTQNNKVNTGIFAAFYLMMQNHQQFYERKYLKFQDSLGYIGGLSNVLIFVSLLINSLVSNYIKLLDMEDLALKLELNGIPKKPYKKSSQLMFPPKRQFYYNKTKDEDNIYNSPNQSSNYQRLVKDGINICKNVNNNDYEINFNDDKTEMYKGIFLKRNKILDEGNNKIKKNNYDEYKIKSSNNNMNTDKKDDYNDNDKLIEKQNFTWFQYLGYMICCKRNNDKILYYENLRKELLSEENIIKNHFELKSILQNKNKGNY